MLPLFRVHLLTASLLAIALGGCAQISNKLPQVSLKPSHDKTTRFSVARLYEKQNRLGAARKLYGELHDDSPDNIEVLHRLAAISTRLGDFEKANQYYEQSLAVDADNSDIMADYGYALYLQNKMEEAEAMLNRSLALNPDNNRAIGNLALLTGMNGRTEEALTLYRSVVGEAEAQANMGYIHVQRGEGEEAMKRYNRALTLDEDMESAANALLKLAALKDSNFDSDSDIDSGTKKTSDVIQIADKPGEGAQPTGAPVSELVRGQSDFVKSAGEQGMIGSATISSPRRVDSTATREVEPATKRNDATVKISLP